MKGRLKFSELLFQDISVVEIKDNAGIKDNSGMLEYWDAGILELRD